MESRLCSHRLKMQPCHFWFQLAEMWEIGKERTCELLLTGSKAKSKKVLGHI